MTGSDATIRVLHVDEDRAFAELTGEFLERESDRFVVETATSAAEALERLDEEPAVDCVVSDYDMSGTDGIELLGTVRETRPDLPFLLFTGEGSEDVASEAISAGVTDYLRKRGGTEQYAILADRVTDAVDARAATDEAERRSRSENDRFQRLLDTSPAGIVILDADGRIVRANSRAERTLGLAAPEATDRRYDDPDWRIVDADGGPIPSEELPFERVMRTGEPVFDYEHGIERPDGSRRWLSVNAAPLAGSDGAVEQVVAVVRDVTDEDRHERKLAALHGVADDLLGAATVDEVCRHTVAAAEELLELDLSLVAIEDDGVLRVRATSDELPPGAPGAMDVEEGIAGKTYRTGEPFLVDDAATHDDARSPGRYRSVLSLPIGDHGNFQAVDETPGAFDRDDLELARLLIVHTENALDRLASERDLATERDRRSALFENTTDPIMEATFEDGTPVVTGVNPAFESVFGIDAGDVVGRSVAEAVVPEEDRDDHERIIRRVRGGEPVETEVRRRTATGIREFLLRVVPIDVGESPRVYGQFTDVTERKRSETALNALHEATREFMDATDREAVAERAVETARTVLGQPICGLWLHGRTENLLRPAAATEDGLELTGSAPTYAPGGSLAWEAFETGTVGVYDDLREEPGRYNPETPIRSEIVLPLGDEGVMTIGSTDVGAFDDLDVSLARVLAETVEAALSRATREQELRRQNERLEEFASVVSHDLRNPLNVIGGSLDLAERTGDPEHFGRARRAIDRMDRLIDDLLTLAREGETIAETSAVALPAVVERCWETVGTDDATLRVETTRAVRADRNRLGQLLENLVGNAVEHGGDGVTVTVGDLDGGFHVADDGPGIPADERERVFEAGYSTSADGTGFGLRIVRRIAEAHGWSVRVTESADGGARIEVTGVDVVD